MTDPERLRAELWTRDASPPPDDPRRAVRARLRDLAADDRIDDVAVRVWGRWAAPPSERPAENGPVRARLASFRAWADRTGHSLAPAFERCERSSLVSTERTEAVRLPLQCLAVFADDRPVGVFPCSTAAGTRTVEDCLRRLENGEPIGGLEPGNG